MGGWFNILELGLTGQNWVTHIHSWSADQIFPTLWLSPGACMHNQNFLLNKEFNIVFWHSKSINMIALISLVLFQYSILRIQTLMSKSTTELQCSLFSSFSFSHMPLISLWNDILNSNHPIFHPFKYTSINLSLFCCILSKQTPVLVINELQRPHDWLWVLSMFCPPCSAAKIMKFSWWGKTLRCSCIGQGYNNNYLHFATTSKALFREEVNGVVTLWR